MAYREETFSIPKISVNGSFRLNIGAILKRVVVNKILIVKDVLVAFLSSATFLLSVLVTKVRRSLVWIFREITGITSEEATTGTRGLRRRLTSLGSTFRYNFPKKKFLRVLLIALIIVGLVLTAKFIYSLRNSATSSKTEVMGAKATQSVNKEITFPLRDEDGKEISTISYLVENAELRDEILVKGEKATAIKGRTFLIFSIKIKNGYDKSIEINTKDYIRLRIAGQEELLAPDIHNDPVTVQAISTKFTRLGFPINDTDRQMILQLGEINGPKETVEIRF